MPNPLAEARASNTEQPILTVEIRHPILASGAIRFVQGVDDFIGFIPGVGNAQFDKSGINVVLPSKDSQGTQQLSIRLDNVSNAVFLEMRKIVEANRTTQTEVEVNTRIYLASDTSSPKESIPMIAETIAITAVSATIGATFAPLYDNFFPRERYYPTGFHGVKYA
jgi:hypothetical protein